MEKSGQSDVILEPMFGRRIDICGSVRRGYGSARSVMVPTVGVSYSNPVCSVFLGCLIRSNICPSAIMLLCNVDDEGFVIARLLEAQQHHDLVAGGSAHVIACNAGEDGHGWVVACLL